METINIVNVGPLSALSIPLPADGGVVVLRGRNGAGKTTALEAVAALTGDGAALEPRRGFDRGSVEGLGAKLSVTAKRTSRGGELSVTRLEGASADELVDPGIADPERADAARIVALCRLVGASADLGSFAEAVGVNAKAASTKTAQAKTLPDLAASLRRDLQAAAREAESVADAEGGAASAALALSCGVLGDAKADVDAARSALTTATVDHAKLVERGKAAADAVTRIAQSRAALDAAERDYSGPSVEQAQTVRGEWAKRVGEIEAELAQARESLSAATHQLTAAESHAKSVAALRATLAQTPEPVAAESILSAAASVNEARAAVDEAARTNERAAARRKADGHLAKSDTARVEAKRLREAADKCDAALQSILARVMPEGLSIHDGRLIFERGGKVDQFGKLSHGERWRLAIDVALDAMPTVEGMPKVLVIGQEAFEGLDPANRAAINAHAKARGCVILTAECSDGDVRAIVQEPVAAGLFD